MDTHRTRCLGITGIRQASSYRSLFPERSRRALLLLPSSFDPKKLTAAPEFQSKTQSLHRARKSTLASRRVSLPQSGN